MDHSLEHTFPSTNEVIWIRPAQPTVLDGVQELTLSGMDQTFFPVRSFPFNPAFLADAMSHARIVQFG